MAMGKVISTNTRSVMSGFRACVSLRRPDRRADDRRCPDGRIHTQRRRCVDNITARGTGVRAGLLAIC
jgi:hypothetical protein